MSRGIPKKKKNTGKGRKKLGPGNITACHQVPIYYLPLSRQLDVLHIIDTLPNPLPLSIQHPNNYFPTYPQAHLIRTSPSKRLMNMRREPILQLRSIRSEIHTHLLQPLNNHAHSPIITRERSTSLPLTLLHAAGNSPQQQVGDVGGNRLGEGGELACRVADLVGIAIGVQGEDVEGADFL